MKMILLALLVLSSTLSFADISVISDLDDTIKITEASGDPTDLLGDKPYTGFPEFLKGSKEGAPTLHILSASPGLIRSRVQQVLKKHGVAYTSLVLRKNVFEGKFEFKTREIKKIVEASKDDFILIGDDVGEDPEIYREIGRLYPHRILATYIHTVTGRAYVSDAVPYWTSFDLALREYQELRFKHTAMESLIQKLMSEKDLNLIFPKKAQCPSTYLVWEWQLATVFQPEASLFIDKFTGFCQQRQSDIILQ